MSGVERLPGFHGKLPSHGDFLLRRLPHSFADSWDQWLQQSLVQSRQQLGQDWLNYYLTSPIWHFVLAAGICGEHAWAGVTIPSVDKVGRYFPFTIAARLPENAAWLPILLEQKTWFLQIETLALSGLKDEFNLEKLDWELRALAPIPATTIVNTETNISDLQTMDAMDWRISIMDPEDDTSILMKSLFYPCAGSYWHTDGSEAIAASLLLCRQLPKVAGYVAMLDGRWQQWGWREEVDSAFP